MRKPELLVPASSLEVLKTAVRYGADAVYIGGEVFGLRAKAKNFTLEEMAVGVNFAHEHGVKVYVTANILAHNADLEPVKAYFNDLKKVNPDALIIADPAIFTIAKEILPEMELHISTQANNTNYGTYNFWWNLGAKRVVSARELSIKEIKEIREHIPDDMEIETFVHGAMCIHYSGRCMLSNYFSRRDANRGGCSQSCRWYYDIFEKDQQLNHDEIVPFSMSSKDMSLVDELPKLIELGVDSFKIEGRMKSLHYIATVVSTYRKLIDTYCADPDHFNKEGYRKEIEKAANRALCTGFFKDFPNSQYQLYNQRDEHPTQDFCARVLHYDTSKQEAMIEQRNYFKVGDTIEFFSPHHENILIQVKEIYNEDREAVEVANHPMEILYLKCEQPLSEFDMGRKVLTNEK